MESTTAIHPPRTLMEVFKSLPEGTLVQLIENSLVMTPSPSDAHQKILVKISNLLFNFIEKRELGEIRVAPYDVYLDRKNAYQPDIVFIGKDRIHLIEEDGLHGPPDLVVEILSHSTAKYDLEEKKDVYERTGVREYWIVEPTTKSVQEFFLNEDKNYGEPEKREGSIHSRLLDTEFRF